MPRLTIDNSLNGLCDVFDEQASPEVMANQMILKMQLITSVHKFLLENVEHAQKKQRKAYATRKGLQTFKGFTENTKIKMRRLERRNTSLLITKMARDFRNMIMAAEYVFSKISRGSVGNGQEGICNCIYLQIDV
jgi:hypothetical protein